MSGRMSIHGDRSTQHSLVESRSFPMQAVAQGGRIYDVHDNVQRDRSDCCVGDGIRMAHGPVHLEKHSDSDRADHLKKGTYPANDRDETPPG